MFAVTSATAWTTGDIPSPWCVVRGAWWNRLAQQRMGAVRLGVAACRIHPLPSYPLAPPTTHHAPRTTHLTPSQPPARPSAAVRPEFCPSADTTCPPPDG